MDWFYIISIFIGFITGITIHESAHAWMGNKLGDSTAKDLGRISINPIRHIDPIGSLALPIMGLLSPAQALIGWAKPTPYNPENLKNKKKDELLIALAGPISNFVLSALLMILIYISVTGAMLILGEVNSLVGSILDFIYYIMVGNLILGFFNLLPIPPLDGATLFTIFVHKKYSYQLAMFNHYGFAILILASFSPFGNLITNYLDTCIVFCLRITGFI